VNITLQKIIERKYPDKVKKRGEALEEEKKQKEA
jgi:hypothetical protein